MGTHSDTEDTSGKDTIVLSFVLVVLSVTAQCDVTDELSVTLPMLVEGVTSEEETKLVIELRDTGEVQKL